jgi:hypothetical protein
MDAVAIIADTDRMFVSGFRVSRPKSKIKNQKKCRDRRVHPAIGEEGRRDLLESTTLAAKSPVPKCFKNKIPFPNREDGEGIP